jgi:putative cardiolipin synthase
MRSTKFRYYPAFPPPLSRPPRDIRASTRQAAIHAGPAMDPATMMGPGDFPGDRGPPRPRPAWARVRPGAGVAGLVLALGMLLLAGCASLPTDYPRSASTALTDTGQTRLGQVSGRMLAARPGTSGILVLNRGTDAFQARLALADTAEKSLDIQYYIWHADTTGRVLAERVLRAADRGVRVRLLLDDIGAAAEDGTLLAVDTHPQVEIRLFNPVAARSTKLLGMMADFPRVNRRMHNKSFTADNQVMIVGGRNIGDEYFAARPDIEFADLDVLAIGPVVAEVSDQFDRYWNSPLAFPIAALSRDMPGDEEIRQRLAGLRAFVAAWRQGEYARALESSDLARRLAAGAPVFSYGKARVLADDPAKILATAADDAGGLLPGLMPEFQALASELILVSPYFIPGDTGVARLGTLPRRDVKVRVLTNSLASTDVPVVHAGYRKYRQALLEGGVELHEFKPTAIRDVAGNPGTQPRGRGAGGALSGSSLASLHAKALIFDRRALFVGSMNLDPRSVFTNTEIGVVVENPELAAAVAEKLDELLPEVSFRLELAPAPGPDGAPGIAWVARQDGEEVRYASEPMTSVWQRFKTWLYSLLPIEHLL